MQLTHLAFEIRRRPGQLCLMFTLIPEIDGGPLARVACCVLFSFFLHREVAVNEFLPERTGLGADVWAIGLDAG